MRKLITLFILLIVVLLAGCKSNNQTNKLPKGVHRVTVIKKIDASEYLYLDVKENSKDYWIAVLQMNVKKGDILYFSKSIKVKNFKSFGHTFKTILFVNDISKTLSIYKHQNIYYGKSSTNVNTYINPAIRLKNKKQTENFPNNVVHKIIVNKKINTSKNTFLYVDENGKNYWICVLRRKVKKGDILYFTKYIKMRIFHSNDLDRDFSPILFIKNISKHPKG